MGSLLTRPDPIDAAHQNKPEQAHRRRSVNEHSSHKRRPANERSSHQRMPANDSSPHRRRRNAPDLTIEDEMNNAFFNEADAVELVSQGIPLESITMRYPHPPPVKNMEKLKNSNYIFMINPFRYDSSHANRMPEAINERNGYIDRWDENHVHMPCSPFYKSRNKHPIWNDICRWLIYLKQKCDTHVATLIDLKKGLESFSGCQNDIECLETLIERTYSNEERAHFMYKTLSRMCDLVLELPSVCTQPPPLLHAGTTRSVTMSQRQAASLLACAFFCLFPNRSEHSNGGEFERYQNPNFDKLYERGSPEKIEKLKCILHYFQRVTEIMPAGVITIRRVVLNRNYVPLWREATIGLCDLHLTTGKKIEDINNILQVDFANKYIGGGVLGSGCVQEEIRFSISPEMLISLLVCEVMEPNECIFLIGCERYSLYKGYANSFKFDGDYVDYTPKDNWGQRWCHVVAMDAMFFRDKFAQYDMKNVDRELLKAYTSFRPLENGPDYEFGIATGNWGCGAFNGDQQLKAIIQLMAASVAQRPLIYTTFGDKNLVKSFFGVYNYLQKQGAIVADLYYYLHRYANRYNEMSLFEYILRKPISSLRS